MDAGKRPCLYLRHRHTITVAQFSFNRPNRIEFISKGPSKDFVLARAWTRVALIKRWEMAVGKFLLR